MVSIISSITNTNLYYSSAVSEKLDEINTQLKDLPAVLDTQTLEKLQNGEYDITLEEYSNMNTYRMMMSALYGNSSANGLSSAMNRYLGYSNNRNISARDFIQGLEERGVSRDSALKLYTALRSYTSMSTMLGQRNSFVSAKI